MATHLSAPTGLSAPTDLAAPTHLSGAGGGGDDKNFTNQTQHKNALENQLDDDTRRSNNMSDFMTIVFPAPHARKHNGGDGLASPHTIFTVDETLPRSARSKNKPTRFRESDEVEEERTQKARALMPPPATRAPKLHKYNLFTCNETIDFSDINCLNETAMVGERECRANALLDTKLTDQMRPPSPLSLCELFAF